MHAGSGSFCARPPPELPKDRAISEIPTPVPPEPPRSPPVGSYGLLVAAGLLYAPYLAALLAAPPWTEPGKASGEELWSEAWADMFAIIFGGGLWLALAGLTVLAGRKGHAPPAWKAVSAILFVCAAVATLVAARTYLVWPGGGSILVAALLPPLVAFYGVAARLETFAAGVKRFLPAAALASVGVLAACSLLFASIDPLLYPARLAEQKRRWAVDIARRNAESESEAARWEQGIAKLGPDSPLSAWLDYVNGAAAETPLHERAVAGARQAKARQEEAAALLENGQANRLAELWRFDLAATPALCAAYDRALKQIAATDGEMEMIVGERLKRQTPNIEFLLAANCDLSAGLDAAEARAKKVAAALPGFPEWADFPATLSALRRKR